MDFALNHDRNYPDKALWKDTNYFGGHTCAYDILRNNGTPGFDTERLIHTAGGEKLMDFLKLTMIANKEDTDTISHWAEQGIEKKLWNTTTPELRWASYAPAEARGSMEKWPVIFAFHGNLNTIMTSEGFGFVHRCREDRYLVVCPEVRNSDPDSAEEQLEHMLSALEQEGYPIDRSRIYAVGMSKGGCCAMLTGLRCSDRIAAVAAHGSSFALKKDAPMGLSAQDLLNQGTALPLYLAVGEFDMEQAPMNADTLTGLNVWLQVLGCNTIQHGSDGLLQLSGASFYQAQVDELDYDIYDFANNTGHVLCRLSAIHNFPHWTAPSFAELSWAFLQQFRRADGHLVIDPLLTESIRANRVFESRPTGFNPLTPDRPFGQSAEIPPMSHVNADGSVDVAFHAPAAQEVRLMLPVEQRSIPLTRSETGLWTARIPYVSPGPKVCVWMVDGVDVLSGTGIIQHGQNRSVNYIEFPEPNQNYLLLRNVPHGAVRQEYYWSSINGCWETCLVYTPANYGCSNAEYPVLYLQHGAGEDETSWMHLGKMNFILDNLIAEGKAVPMVVVMNNGMALPEPGSPGEAKGNFAFTDRLLTDCIPFIESHYRVKSDKWHRAMAGLSMGSCMTSMTVLSHPDQFAWCGLFSGFLSMPGTPPANTDYLKILDNPAVVTQELKLLWHGWGREDNLVNHFRTGYDYLVQKQIASLPLYVNRIYNGRHDWQVWRQCLRDFCQLLFR